VKVRSGWRRIKRGEASGSVQDRESRIEESMTIEATSGKKAKLMAIIMPFCNHSECNSYRPKSNMKQDRESSRWTCCGCMPRIKVVDTLSLRVVCRQAKYQKSTYESDRHRTVHPATAHIRSSRQHRRDKRPFLRDVEPLDSWQAYSWKSRPHPNTVSRVPSISVQTKKVVSC